MRKLVCLLFCVALIGCGRDETEDPLSGPSEEVDGFWGDAPDLETRLATFESIWTTMAAAHATFITTDVDWDWVYEEYRARVEEAESYGRYYQVLSEMLGLLQDTHTSVESTSICEAPQASRPPIFRTNCL